MSRPREPQKQEFLAGEGDQWFVRNRAALAKGSLIQSRAIERLAFWLPDRNPSRVLEIGCGQGDNLNALARCKRIQGFGIDPSSEAIEAGSKAFPSLDLRVSTADELPFESNSMDVVWFGFCLYLVDRSLLHRAVAEADRVLADGGCLGIVDFDPDIPSMREYSHRAGLWSYKMDHSRLFLANPAYSLVEKTSATHSDEKWGPDPQDRVGIWICRKNLVGAYRPA